MIFLDQFQDHHRTLQSLQHPRWRRQLSSLYRAQQFFQQVPDLA